MLTNEEQFQLQWIEGCTGYCCRWSEIEELLDCESAMEASSDACVHIGEAKGCFPEEDFMDYLIDELKDYTKGCRGENKKALMEFVNKMNLLQAEVNQQSEYGADELKKALEVLGGER